MTPKTDWLKRLEKDGSYKSDNLKSWKKNTPHWMNIPLRHVIDNNALIDDILIRLLKSNATVLDMGCGDGFLYNKIRNLFPDVNYIGVDFNREFISHLNSQFSSDKNAKFRVLDLEEDIPEDLISVADVVFSYFVFLEIEKLSNAIRFGAKALKKSGVFSIYTIEYTYLILAVSRGMRDFKRNLAKYERIRSESAVPYTFQKIDLGDSESEDLSYGSVFHSTADYIQNSIQNGLSFVTMLENIKTDKFHPKVYQYFEFTKKDNL